MIKPKNHAILLLLLLTLPFVSSCHILNDPLPRNHNELPHDNGQQHKH